MKSCVYIPNNKKGEPSELFIGLQKLTGNREDAKALWGISQETTIMSKLNDTVGLKEPTVLEFLNSIPDVQNILSKNAYVGYLNLKEGLNEKSFDTFEQVLYEKERLLSDYSSVLPIIEYKENKYKIVLENKETSSIEKFAEQEALNKLNDKVIKQLSKIGLAVEEDRYLEVPGKLDPLNAKINAENLLTAIKVAKGLEGQKAIPEEFAHVLVEGFNNHPLMSRILKTFDNLDLIKETLGASFDEYNKLYSGNIERLKKEAVSKLIAQYLANREGISENITGISNRFLNIIQSALVRGDENYIEDAIKQLDSDIKSFIEELSDEDTFKLFDLEVLKKAPSMYQVANNISKLQEIAEKAYETVAKKMKIENLRRKDSKIPKEDIIAFNNLKKLMDKKKYADSCISFLGTCMDSVSEVIIQLERNKEKITASTLSAKDIKIGCKMLKNANNILSAYSDVVQRMQSISKEDSITNELTEEDINKIEQAASEVNKVLGDIKTLEKELRLQVLIKFYEKYWGKDKIIGKGDSAKVITLEQVLESTVGDITTISRWVNSMSDMPDMLLQLVDVAYKDSTAKRDANIFDLQQQLGILQQKLTEATGSRDTSFMYEKDENGNPTGMIISDRDFKAFYKAKNEYRQSLKDSGLSKEEIIAKVKLWEIKNTEVVSISERKKERLPKKSSYPSNALKQLTPAQKEYYDVAMRMKIALDAMLPSNRTHTYWAVQKKVRGFDAVVKDKSVKKAFDRFKNIFVVDRDDTEFGEMDLDEGKYMVTDFGGNPLKKVPVFYTSWLGEDMKYLDTNFTDSMLAYGAMAYNYDSVNEMVDAFELTNLQMKDRDIYQKEGNKTLRTRFKWLDEAFGSDYSIKGANSVLQQKLDNYLDSNIYGKRKNQEITASGFNYGKAGDALKAYSSIVNMGYNLFSGTANASMGLMQTILNAVGGEHFGLKDMLWAHKEYFKKTPGSIADSYSDIKDNKLSLLTTLFDTEEDFFSDIHDSGFNKNVLGKMASKHNPLILNSMGEHYLHSIGMLSILNNIKCKKPGDTEATSLYDIFKEEEVKDSNNKILYKKLVIPEGYKIVEKENGEYVEKEDLNPKYLQQLKMRIQNVNHGMHGAFGAIDRGDAHRNVMGRLILQYRQWMPAYYMNRFKSRRYNITTNQEEEGFYLTGVKFIWNTLKDLKNLKFQIGTRYKNLSKHEKSNLHKSLLEVCSYYIIGLILSGWKGDDDDDNGLATLLKYNLYRVRMELGASAPTSTEFLKNVTTLVNSPIPCMRLTDNLINIVDITNMFDEIESGKYKGWSKWERDLFYAAPFVRNIDKVVDIVNGDTSILNPYKKD